MSNTPCSSEKKRLQDVFRKAEYRENFDNWIHCLCVVNFDLELGQAIEVNKCLKFTKFGFRLDDQNLSGNLP